MFRSFLLVTEILLDTPKGLKIRPIKRKLKKAFYFPLPRLGTRYAALLITLSQIPGSFCLGIIKRAE